MTILAEVSMARRGRRPIPSATTPRIPSWIALSPWMLLAAALAVRVYYLGLTWNQPVWWDEAEYLVKARAIAFGTPATGYVPGRPPFFPLVMSAVYAAGLGESAIRLLLVVVSTGTVYLTYRIGMCLAGPLAGIAGAWLFGLFYVPVFYSMRIMTEIPHLALGLLGLHLFLLKRPMTTVLGAAVLTLAVFTRYPAGLMFVVLGVYVAVTERTAAMRRREYHFAGTVAVLVAMPFLLHSYWTYGDPLHALKVFRYVMPAMDTAAKVDGVYQYFAWARSALGWLLTLMIAGGLVLLVVGEAPGPQKGPRARAEGATLLIFTWMLVPTLYFGLFVRPVHDRYVILALPPAFLAAGCLVAWVAKRVARSGLVSAGTVVWGMLAALAVPLLQQTDAIVRDRRESFGELRDAAHWLGPRLSDGTVVLSKSVAQLTYYTSHANAELPDDRSRYDALRRGGQADFVIVSNFEEHPRWVLETPPDALGLQVVARFPDVERPIVYVLAPVGTGGADAH